MKRLLAPVLAALVALPAFSFTPAAVADEVISLAAPEPSIKAIRGRKVVVEVPPGFERVILQKLTSPRHGKRPKSNKAEQPEWRSVGVKYPGSDDRKVVFQLNQLTGKRNLRVIGTRGSGVPDSLLTGITDFLPEDPTADVSGSGLNSSGDLKSTSIGGGVVTNSVTDTAVGGSGGGEVRVVSESDIWKKNGNRLYYFNERRGLQVFDIANPDDPALLGTLHLPAMGEDMYLLDDQHVVLIKRASDWYWWDFGGLGIPIIFNIDVLGVSGGANLASNSASLSLSADASTVAASARTFLTTADTYAAREIVVVDVSTGQPKVTGRVAFDGSVVESRLVGKVLYLATSSYGRSSPTEQLRWGTDLISFDLHDPANPVESDRVRLGSWAQAVMATNQHFYAASYASNYWNNEVSIVDISDPNGAMTSLGKVEVEGYVNDKFKLHEEDGVLTVITSLWRTTGDPGNLRNQPLTKVTTFSLAQSFPQLGTLELAKGETVRATRFDQGLAYIVTFQQIDPLWVVDLSNATSPTVLGHVDAPGFSTYIEPLGNRLVTIGFVNWRPAVSLFKINKIGKPTLIKQIILGAGDNSYVWSPATYDEKAFSVLPEDNLILIPINGWDYNTALSRDGVQLVDLFEDDIVKRGVAQHPFAPQRATVHLERIVSISPTHLISFDATDRDKPVLTADLEIAWGVDYNFVVGDYLVEVGTDWEAGGNANAITISPANDPDTMLDTLTLPPQSIVSASVRDGVLYVFQIDASPLDPVLSTSVEANGKKNYVLSTVDVSKLPEVSLLGRVAGRNALISNSNWYSGVQPLWIGEKTVAYSLSSDSAYRVWFSPNPKIANIEESDYWYPYWSLSRSQRIFAFDVSDSHDLSLASTFELGAGKPWDVSEPVVAGNSLYASYRYLGLLTSNVPNDSDAVALDSKRIGRHFLHVVDYSDPTHPFAEEREPNLPGQLVGVSGERKVVFTTGQRYDAQTGAPFPSGHVLHVSALDGKVAHLLDQLPISTARDALKLDGDRAFVFDGQPSEIWVRTKDVEIIDEVPGAKNAALSTTDDIAYIWWPYPRGEWKPNPKKSSLQTWELGADGKFAKLGELVLDHQTSFKRYGELGVAFAKPNEPDFLNLKDASNPLELGAIKFNGPPTLNYDRADGSIDRGALWIPCGSYGVEVVPIPAQPE